MIKLSKRVDGSARKVVDVDTTHCSDVSERGRWFRKRINRRRVEHGRSQNPNTQTIDSFSSLMSGYTNFAVVGAGNFGTFIIQQLLKDKAAGTVKEVVVLTRQVKHPFINQVVHDVLSTTVWSQRDLRPPLKATPR